MEKVYDFQQILYLFDTSRIYEMGKICPLCAKEFDSLVEFQHGGKTLERCSECENDGWTVSWLICPRCGKKATYLQEYQIDGEIKKHCSKCQGADHRKQIKSNERKNFFKRHWWKWITFVLVVIGFLIAKDFI